MSGVSVANGLASFIATATEASKTSDCLIGHAQTDNHEIIGDVVDDSTNITGVLTEGSLRQLKDRFLDRFAAIVARPEKNSATNIALMREHTDGMATNIWLASDDTYTYSDYEMSSNHRIAFEKIEQSLSQICKHSTEDCTIAKHELWQSIVELHITKLEYHVLQIQSIFAQHKDLFEQKLETMTGLDGNSSTDLDCETSDLLIQVRERTYPLEERKIDKEIIKGILGLALKLCRLPYAQDRVAKVMDTMSFSVALYHHLQTLSVPTLAFDTFVQLAHHHPCFSTVRIYHGLPDSGSLDVRPRDAPFHDSVIEEPARIIEKPKQRLVNEGSNDVPQYPVQKFADTILEFLSPSERHLTPIQLRPLAKRQTWFLLNSLLRGRNPSATDEAYWVFGYAACRNKEESERLGGLYQELLKGSNNKEEIFADLWKALEANKLEPLFEDYGYQEAFEQQLPGAKLFLSAPQNQRPTVWRLIQFLNADKMTDPPGCLRRDYGFKYCKGREHVQLLKAIYGQILKRATPLELHDACVKSKLYDFGISHAVEIDPSNKRLFQNMINHPDLGYEDGLPTKGYEGPHFNKRAK